MAKNNKSRVYQDLSGLQGSKTTKNKLALRFTIALFMSILASPFFQYADAQNVTLLNSTLANVEPFLDTPGLNVFYPIFLMIALFLFMAYALKTRHDREKYGFIFAIAAMIISLVITMIFIAPVDFVFTSEKTTVTIEEINWAGTNETTYNTNVVKNKDVAILLTQDNQFRFIFVAFFTVFTFFNGLLAIRILTGW